MRTGGEGRVYHMGSSEDIHKLAYFEVDEFDVRKFKFIIIKNIFVTLICY